jgi:hypothetical protein
MYHSVSLRRLINPALALAVTCALGATSLAQSPTQIYQQIKNLEGNFPLPTPKESVNVGSFDATTGTFTGKVSRIVNSPPDDTGGNKPGERLVAPVAHVNAVAVELIFAVANRVGVFKVTANGVSALASPGQNSVTVSVGSATQVNWTVWSGSKSYSDTLVINRPQIIGAGAFIVPALPLAIVYEPPPDSRNKNKATYTKTSAIGTKVTATFSHEGSTTVNAVPSQFAGVSNLKDKMSTLASLVKNAPGVPYAQQIAGALSTIASGLGSVSASETSGKINTSDHSLELTSQLQTTISTDENNGGPGVGDVVYYLKNPKLVWLAENGRVTLALLDRGMVSTVLVSNLKANLNTGWQGLDPATVRDLLSLDPFANPTGREIRRRTANGARLNLPLPSARFSYQNTYEVNGVAFTEALKRSETQTSSARQAGIQPGSKTIARDG